jgi:hypothetical protein
MKIPVTDAEQVQQQQNGWEELQQPRNSLCEWKALIRESAQQEEDGKKNPQEQGVSSEILYKPWRQSATEISFKIL